jgi:hypothetical protein
MGHLLKIKCVRSRVNVNILASKSVPFRPTTVKVPNFSTNLTVQLMSYFVFVNVQQLLKFYLGTLRRVRVRWVAIVAKSKRWTAKLAR